MDAPRMRRLLATAAILALSTLPARPGEAARVVAVETLDEEYVLVHVADGTVVHHEISPDVVTRHDPPLDVAVAARVESWMVISTTDPAFAAPGRHPAAVSRKTRLSGLAQMEWVEAKRDYRYESTDDHWLFLRLPAPLRQGHRYRLALPAGLTGAAQDLEFRFDVFGSRSEAVHVNLVGYRPGSGVNAADVYAWLGEKGARDYEGFEGRAVRLLDVASGRSRVVGKLGKWKPEGADVGGYHLTRSPVWRADFRADRTGTYRLVVDGIGCSQEFRVAKDVYVDPFRVGLLGFFYMRVGQESVPPGMPPPRTPAYIPGRNPAATRVYLTTMHPWHPEWKTFSRGDVWDRPEDWARFRLPGQPVNAGAWGGHADAADWDRHLGHVSIVYDMLLPYLLTGGALDDDHSGIAESGNGIPDVIDEARNEVDFWLRLKDGDGYSHGVTNPNRSHELFQAAPTAMAAWANAANAAMLADALRVAGRPDLVASYREQAERAFRHAEGLERPMLDDTQDVGQAVVRGRDLRMTAAAFLYNVTGDPAYEEVVRSESVCRDAPADLEDGTRNQLWAAVGYLLTPRVVHHPQLWRNMRDAVLGEALRKEVALFETRPSRRATDERTGYFRTIQNVQRTLVAHALAKDPAMRERCLRALSAEADWGLGRNPLNMIEMGTASTPLAAKRSVRFMYTSGREDGFPGVHPGHTPYFNLDDWAPAMTMGRPSRLYESSHPAGFRTTWPIGEACFETPWVWAHSEYTPQQTMRGKLALYGYLAAFARRRVAVQEPVGVRR